MFNFEKLKMLNLYIIISREKRLLGLVFKILHYNYKLLGTLRSFYDQSSISKCSSSSEISIKYFVKECTATSQCSCHNFTISYNLVRCLLAQDRYDSKTLRGLLK